MADTPKKPSSPKVTPAEWDILEVLWQHAPLSAREVFDRLAAPRKGSLQTVRTLLDRLLAKAIIHRRDMHGVWVFTPAYRRDEVIRHETQTFLQRFFRGRPELGAAYFIENETLSPADIKHLQKILTEKLKEAKNAPPSSP